MFKARVFSAFFAFVFATLWLVPAHSALDVRLDLHDVSVLLPLPKPEALNLLPAPSLEAQFGPLIPKAIFDKIPGILPEEGTGENNDTWAKLKLVGFRVDPCFSEDAIPYRCRQQIRMVWQPIMTDSFERDGATIQILAAQDGALHTFYDLTPEEFDVVLSKIITLKKTTEAVKDRPLSVHPIIAKEGLSGAYFKELWNLILAFTGEARLTRITFMQISVGENLWVFGGFDVKAGQLTPITIPRIQKTQQSFLNNSLPRPFYFLGGIVPEPSSQYENLNVLVQDSRKLSEKNEKEVIAAVGAAIRFEHPQRHNPGTLDCVSCHIAQASRTWAFRQYPWLMLDQVHAKEFFQFNRDLTNVSPMQPHTNVLRAFGYFENRPIVSQRTINESAAVINYLETKNTHVTK